ncbi:MAG: HAMP domain-containing sensor histidine kinase [Gemmatimonadaceae bacterium]
MTSDLARLRRRLTAWYALTLGTIVVVLGAGLFVAIRQQIAAQLDASLALATQSVQSATSIREAEQSTASGDVMDAVEELRIPDRELYLFDAAARPLVPHAAPSEIVQAATNALRDSVKVITLYPANDHVLRVYATRFRSRTHRVYVAVAVADQLELEDQYASLIAAFGAAALVALVLFALGGSFLTRKSIDPVERTMSYMRRFMADAAHELRTPLTVLRSRAEVALAADPDAGREREALVAIEREAIRLGSIVEDLLQLARSDAGGAQVALTPIFLDDVTSDAVSAAATLAAHGGITLSIMEFDETPVLGDATLVRQLVMIVLDNAIKFTPAGGSVVVSVTHSPTGALLSVTDSGSGIPPDQIAHVFERFYRGDSARKRGDGSGLGLSIAQSIADAHHAKIAIRSDGVGGTTVEVRFPAPARA